MGLRETLEELKRSGSEKFAAEIDRIKTSYENSKGSCVCVTYTEDEREIVRSGIDSINEVIFCGNKGRIRSLLFCLDMYLDPYYGYNLPYEKDIYESLQKLMIQTQDDDIFDDIRDLLSYGSDYALVNEHFDSIKQDRQADILSDLREILVE